ncbi:adenosine receptor A2b-like [Oculina patagonica]
MAESGQEIDGTLGVLAVLIVVSNVSVCALVCFNKTLRTCTNWLIVSLAVSDILTGGVLLPLQLIDFSVDVKSYLTAIILLSGVANICAVTYDRYVAIMKPLHYPYRAPMLFKRAIVVAWLIPIIYSLLALAWDADPSLTIHVVYMVVLEVLGVVVPYIFITFAYVRIFRQVRRSLTMRRDFESAREQRNERGRISSDAQVAKVFCIISMTFLLSWIPILYITTTTTVFNQPDIVPDALPTVSLFTVATSSLVNPLLYAFLKPDFKVVIRNLCRKRNSTVEALSMKPSFPTPSCQVGTEENTKQREQTTAKIEDNSPEEYDTYL